MPVLLSARITPRLRLYLLPDGMAVALSAALLLLLCAAGPVLSLSDVDCTLDGWLVANTSLECMSALNSLRTNTKFTPANVALVKTVSVPFLLYPLTVFAFLPLLYFLPSIIFSHTFRSLSPRSGRSALRIAVISSSTFWRVKSAMINPSRSKRPWNSHLQSARLSTDRWTGIVSSPTRRAAWTRSPLMPSSITAQYCGI